MTEEDTGRGHRSQKSPLKKQTKVNPQTNHENGAAILQVKSVKTREEITNSHVVEGLETETEMADEASSTQVASAKNGATHNDNIDINGDIVRNGDVSLKHVTVSSKQTGDDNNSAFHCTCGSSEKCIASLRDQHIMEKLIYVIALVTVITLVYSLLEVQWFLPYYYTVSLPILIVFRYFLFFKLEYQYFLLDFCYFGNLFCYISIWACPGNDEVFMVMFAIANGPLMSAILPYRNSLVFHDYDRLTSAYIHVIPAFVSFCIRWYPVATSTHWYSPFIVQATPSFIWLVAVPLGGFLAHFIFYHVLVRVCIRPKEGFIDTYSYLVGKDDGFIARLTRCCGVKAQFWMFALFTMIYCLVGFLFVRLWYDYFIAHCVFLVLVSTLVAWNGGSFYIDVFGKKGLKKEGEESLNQTV
ncbi:uncharacterized protein LOC135489186 [Lineus longissimus]|uniref:uncharacterized protein LOC135489186 n=1 Tax=Lineus longissimus TaxID=88925 RepID=UPI002B4F5080